MVHGKDGWATTPADWNTAPPVTDKGPSVYPWQLAGDFVPVQHEKRVEQSAPTLGDMALEAS